MDSLSETEKKRATEDIKVLTETAREPFLVLDTHLRVVEANATFYKTFRVTRKETENRFIYELGNRQWDIPEFRNLLEKILPHKKVIKDYTVTHIFPKIGRKIIVLNAQQLDTVQLIVLAFEDITVRMDLEKKTKEYTKKLERQVAERTKELSDRVKDLEELTQVMVGRELKMSELKKEIARIKKLKKLNGNNRNNNT